MDSIPNNEISIHKGGSKSVKKLGANRRTVSFSWDEGTDTSDIYQNDGDADYLNASTNNTSPVSYYADTPIKLDGILDYTNGSKIPVVYIPHIPEGPNSFSDDVFYLHNDQFLYGRITSSVRNEVIVGTENETEVIKTSTITIEEEL